jgi:hypothetical protein
VTVEASGSQIAKSSQAEMANPVVSFGMAVEFVVALVVEVGGGCCRQECQ